MSSCRACTFHRDPNSAAERVPHWIIPNFLSDKVDRSALLKVIESSERLTLEELYGSPTATQRSDPEHATHPVLRGIVEELDKQRRTVDHLNPSLRSAMEEVEQEREVEFQVEEIREVQKPAHHKALDFPGLHPAISRFADSGILIGADGYESAFSYLSRTSLGKKCNLCDRGLRLFVSAEFMRTVKLGSKGPDDNFLVSSVVLYEFARVSINQLTHSLEACRVCSVEPHDTGGPGRHPRGSRAPDSWHPGHERGAGSFDRVCRPDDEEYASLRRAIVLRSPALARRLHGT